MASGIRSATPLHDIERDAWLARRRIRVLRLSAALVLTNMDTTIRMIDAAARAGPPPPHP